MRMLIGLVSPNRQQIVISADISTTMRRTDAPVTGNGHCKTVYLTTFNGGECIRPECRLIARSKLSGTQP